MVIKIIGRVFTRQYKKLVNVLRHGKQAGAGIKPIAVLFQFRQFAAGLWASLINLNNVALNRQADGGGNSGNSGANNQGFVLRHSTNIIKGLLCLLQKKML